MFCGKCGNKIKEGSNFCTSCGAPIESNINNTINSINNSNYTNNSNNMNNSNYTNNSNNINNNTQKNGKKGVLKGLMVAGIVISIFIVIEVGTRLIEHGVDKLTEKTQNNSKTSSNKSNNNYGGNNNTNNNNNNNVNNNNNNYGGSTNKTTQKIGSSKTGYLTIPSSYEAEGFNTVDEITYYNENNNTITLKVSESIFAEDKESLKEGVIFDAESMGVSASSVTETTVSGMIGFKYKTYDSQRNIWYGYWELLDNSKDNIIYSIRIYANSQNDEIFNVVNTYSKN